MRDTRRAGQAERQQRYRTADRPKGLATARRAGCWIDRKTGTRWRYGRSVRNSAGAVVTYPPVRITPQAAEPALSLRAGPDPDRGSLAAKLTIRGIAARLARAPSTVSREIRRNGDLDGRCRPHHAEQDRGLRLEMLIACGRRGHQPGCCSVTKRVTTWMLWPPLSATAVGQTHPPDGALGGWLLCRDQSDRQLIGVGTSTKQSSAAALAGGCFTLGSSAGVEAVVILWCLQLPRVQRAVRGFDRTGRSVPRRARLWRI